MSSVVISARTSEALKRVMVFFGIDEYNRPLFGECAKAVGVDQFSRTIEALDAAIQIDSRSGIERRIRARIAQQKELDRKKVGK